MPSAPSLDTPASSLLSRATRYTVHRQPAERPASPAGSIDSPSRAPSVDSARPTQQHALGGSSASRWARKPSERSSTPESQRGAAFGPTTSWGSPTPARAPSRPSMPASDAAPVTSWGSPPRPVVEVAPVIPVHSLSATAPSFQPKPPAQPVAVAKPPVDDKADWPDMSKGMASSRWARPGRTAAHVQPAYLASTTARSIGSTPINSRSASPAMAKASSGLGWSSERTASSVSVSSADGGSAAGSQPVVAAVSEPAPSVQTPVAPEPLVTPVEAALQSTLPTPESTHWRQPAVESAAAAADVTTPVQPFTVWGPPPSVATVAKPDAIIPAPPVAESPVTPVIPAQSPEVPPTVAATVSDGPKPLGGHQWDLASEPFRTVWGGEPFGSDPPVVEASADAWSTAVTRASDSAPVMDDAWSTAPSLSDRPSSPPTSVGSPAPPITSEPPYTVWGPGPDLSTKSPAVTSWPETITESSYPADDAAQDVGRLTIDSTRDADALRDPIPPRTPDLPNSAAFDSRSQSAPIAFFDRRHLTSTEDELAATPPPAPKSPVKLDWTAEDDDGPDDEAAVFASWGVGPAVVPAPAAEAPSPTRVHLPASPEKPGAVRSPRRATNGANAALFGKIAGGILRQAAARPAASPRPAHAFAATGVELASPASQASVHLPSRS